MEDVKYHIRIRAYRAIDDIESCKRFAEGHANVLRGFYKDPPKISTADDSWMKNPNVYVILMESITGEKLYGGARIHVTGGSHELPIVAALKSQTEEISNKINKQGIGKVGELCALWNSRSVVGCGLSILLIRSGVAEAGVVISGNLKLETLYGLCAPYTLEPTLGMGFEIDVEVGDKGSFPYPKPDLPATVVVINDLGKLPNAKIEERNSIFELRENPKLLKVEPGPRGNVEIEYDLKLT